MRLKQFVPLVDSSFLKPLRRGVSLVGLIGLLGRSATLADPLITFDFSRDLKPSSMDARISLVTPLQSTLSTAVRDSVKECARANSWQSPGDTNYYRFSFAVQAGYVVEVSRVRFDSLSAKTSATTNGPRQYEVRLGVDGAPFLSLSRGWQSLAADNTWHTGLTADNSGVSVGNLSGYVTIALAATGATDKTARWYIDNLVVEGKILPDASAPAPVRLQGLFPHDRVGLNGVVASQYYSLQHAPTPLGDWAWLPGAVNLRPTGADLPVDIRSLTQPQVFFRAVTSRKPMPSVDLTGYWRVTSADSTFGEGLVRLEQTNNLVSFEGRLLGEVSDATFRIAENGATWVSGSLNGDALSLQRALPLASMASSNNLTAMRFTGPAFEVWQGTNLLTATQAYDPAANGYVKVGGASETATFAVDRPYLIVAANAQVPIDSLGGPDGAFVDDPTVMSIVTANTTDAANLKGETDLRSALVGSAVSGRKYRGYATFGPVTWNSLTVHVGSAETNAPPPVEAFAPSLLRQVFFLEHDSDGTAPLADAEVELAFEPNGVAQLYIAQPDYAIAYRGSYTYSAGQLSLKFSDPDFSPNVKFALDLVSPKVSLPFDVFTNGTKGPSVWRRENATVEHVMWVIFTAATVNEQLPVNQAIARARAYAEAVAAGRGARLARSLALQQDPEYPLLLDTSPLADGVRLRYSLGDGTVLPVDVQLYGRAAAGGGKALTASTLASDPRVHLNPTTAVTGVDDPARKTALLISPFYTKRVLSWNPFDPASAIDNDRAVLSFDAVEQKLASRGYAVKRLLDEEASVVNLARELLGAPGFLYFCTHGGPDGQLATGIYLGTTWRVKTAFKEFERQKQLLTAAGYADLVNYRDLDEEPLAVTAIRNGMTSRYHLGVIALKPPFWKWLRSKGADFGSSLVYIGACHTAEEVDLRNAIRAHTMFAYSDSVPSPTVGAVGRYLVDSLARRTHTAEETYYNLVRTVRTGQMIYAEDARLNGFTDWGDGSTVADHLHGHSSLRRNGAGPDVVMEFVDIGWLGASSANTADPGDVWWLLFASRWSTTAQGGLDSVLHCWNDYWRSGKGAGIGDTFCLNCAPGSIPNQNEVAYALYLLSGQTALSFNGTLIPRWTLHDAAP